MLQPIYLTSTKGRLYYFDFEKELLSVVFQASSIETMMGLEKNGGIIYAAGKTQIYKLSEREGKLLIGNSFRVKTKAQFHQMTIIGDYLYVTVTQHNQIWKFDLNLIFREAIKIDPPDKSKPVRYGKNYNHLNSIWYRKKKFYVGLNWFTQKQYGSSGVAVLDNHMKEIDRFELGWETHNYVLFENQEYVLCSSAGRIKKVNHPHRSGLMVDRKLVFEYDADLYFCKDFSIDKEFIYIVGGGVATRGDRDFTGGVLFVLDRKFNLVCTHMFNNSGQILGCLLPHQDFTKGGGVER